MVQQPYWGAGGAYVDAHGDPIVQQAGYTQAGGPWCGEACDGYGQAPCYGCPPGYGYDSCGPGGFCGGHGGGPLSKCRGLLSSLLSGSPVEQCGPHYFDFAAEYLNLKRESPVSDSTVLSTFGFTTPGVPIPDDQVAIDGGDLGGDEHNGYRLTGRLDVGALSVFEFSYSGLYSDDGDDATALADPLNPTDPTPTLYSVFSDFGSTTNGVIAGPDFAETDDALEHRVGLESELHTVEASLRRYWVGYSPRVSGTLLIGFRYTELQELLDFYSMSDDGEINIELGADNHLAGLQVGGDAWVTVLQGLRLGAEGKVGIYNNSYDLQASNDLDGNEPVSLGDDQVAFLTEAKLMVVANITPSLSVRGGYEILYMSELALVGDNLTAIPPYGTDSAVVDIPAIDDEGDAFWHGFNVGMEYTY